MNWREISVAFCSGFVTVIVAWFVYGHLMAGCG